MSSMPFYIADSFTQTRYTGNPAGVVLPDTELTESQMLAIAGELHLESAFAVPFPTPDADYVVAYYTGAARVPLCGHDTIALASVLAQTGRLATPGKVRIATDVGILSVSVAADGLVTMDQALPQFGQTLAPKDAAEALGLPVTEITKTGLPVQVVSTGSPFLVVPVAHRAAISALAPDMNALIAFGDSLDDFILGIYLWTAETIAADAKIHGRCFCPAAGLPEDPVTGTASGAVGTFLARHGQLVPNAEGKMRFRTEQGYAMGRPGHAEVELKFEKKTITSVQVSGHAVLVAAGSLTAPSGTITA